MRKDHMPTQTTSTPRPKVIAAGAGGMSATVLVALVNALGLDMPAEVAAALVTVWAFGAGYLKRDAGV